MYCSLNGRRDSLQKSAVNETVKITKDSLKGIFNYTLFTLNLLTCR